MNGRRYYEAYDDRYKQVHAESLQWFRDIPSEIVMRVMARHCIRPSMRILEVGCGEGRDARYLLCQGYDVLATDVSPEAIDFCQKSIPAFAEKFQVLDCIEQRLPEKYDFIYAIAVVHMLVLEEDRAGFYRFIQEQLRPSGIALICSMGDGTYARETDVSRAFELQERTHEETGRTIRVAGTSCRVVTFSTFESELMQHGFEILQQGITTAGADFPTMMYAVVRNRKQE